MIITWNCILTVIFLCFASLSLKHFASIIDRKNEYANYDRVPMILHNKAIQINEERNNIKYKIDCNYSYTIHGTEFYGNTAVYGRNYPNDKQTVQVLYNLLKTEQHVFVDRSRPDRSFIIPGVNVDAAHNFAVESSIGLAAGLSLALSLISHKKKLSTIC